MHHATRASSRNYTQADYGDFLKSCGAEPCTVKMYAKWLSAYLEEGGKVSEYGYKFHGNKWYKATKSTNHQIPSGYGSSSIHLLVLSRKVQLPLQSTSGDHREGWEWGHSEVYILRPRLRKRAWTNEKFGVPCFTDVIPLLSSQAKIKLEQQREAKTSKSSRYDDMRPSYCPPCCNPSERSSWDHEEPAAVTASSVQQLESVPSKAKTVVKIKTPPKVKKEKTKSPYRLAVDEINAINARYVGTRPIQARQGLKLGQTVTVTMAQAIKLLVVTLFLLVAFIIGLAIML